MNPCDNQNTSSHSFILWVKELALLLNYSSGHTQCADLLRNWSPLGVVSKENNPLSANSPCGSTSKQTSKTHTLSSPHLPPGGDDTANHSVAEAFVSLFLNMTQVNKGSLLHLAYTTSLFPTHNYYAFEFCLICSPSERAEKNYSTLIVCPPPRKSLVKGERFIRSEGRPE